MDMSHACPKTFLAQNKAITTTDHNNYLLESISLFKKLIRELILY